MMDKLRRWWRSEPVLCVAVLLAAISSAYSTPQLSYIDFDVLCVLLSLMLVVAELKQIRFLDWVAVELVNKCRSKRQLELVLLAVTYISSMFVTNDVALLTFVPLALVIGRTLQLDMERTVVLQTLAANLGSMLTPAGNPQNLFLYAHYGYTAERFFAVMAPAALVSLAFIVLLWLHGRDAALSLCLTRLPRPHAVVLLVMLLLLAVDIAAVLHWVDKLAALVLTAVVVFACDGRRLLCVDYGLLATFAAFFIFIGNIANSSAVVFLQQSLMGTQVGTYIAALVASQFISNVPAAMLLAGLTQEADALLLGVNIGGLGTMIASMASVISYKLFAAEHPAQAGRYMRTFLYYNILGLAINGVLVWVLLLT